MPLGVKKPLVYDVRQYHRDLFLGDWVAAPPTLLADPLTLGPRVAATGSAVAAAVAPQRRTLAPEAQGLAALVRASCRGLPEDAKALRDAALRAQAAARRPDLEGLEEKAGGPGRDLRLYIRIDIYIHKYIRHMIICACS